MKNYSMKKKCRICSCKNLKMILDLGDQPPANSLLDKTQLSIHEEKFPLRLFWCSECNLVQLLDIVNKEYLFKHYFYMTSASKPILSHFQQYASDIYEIFLRKKSNPLVVEIGSNDGSLLFEFKKLGTEILGIEPASNLSKLANDSKIPTINDFFSSNLAKNISKSNTASVIVANNVIGHIENLHDLMDGIKILIDDDGLFIFEVPYLIDLIEKLEFDTIYHEHLSYFSILPLMRLMDIHGMEIFDIQKQSVHGGTLRIFVSKKNNFPINESVKKYLNLEYEFGLNKILIYEKFSNQIKNLKNEIYDSLKNLKNDGKSIFGYGASAKGNVLLNYCKIDVNLLDFIIDTTPLKQGKFSPGMHIPIVSPNKIFTKGKNDVALLLAWNYEYQILQKEIDFTNKGGKFLIPIPKPILK